MAMADRAGESDGQAAAPTVHDMRQRQRHVRVDPAAPITVQVYSSFESLPDRLSAFLDAAAERSFFCSIPWLRTLLRTAGPATDEPQIYAAESFGRPVAVLVARERRAAGQLKTHMLLGPSHGSYAALYSPILDAELGGMGLREIIMLMARASPPFQVLRFDCLDRHSPEFAALAAAMRGAGMLVQSFVNYRSYFADVQGLTIEQYLAQCPLQTRQIVDRHRRGLPPSDRGRFELIKGGPDLTAALVDYALVDLQSWKAQEAYPDCVAEILPIAAGAGVLRLGLYYIDDEPVAAQIWIIGGDHATIWRVYSVRKFANLPVGTFLTFEMLRRALEAENLCEIALGVGDDEFARDWFARYRERSGLLAFNPRTLKGLIAATRHIGGHAAISLARRMRGVLRRMLRRT